MIYLDNAATTWPKPDSVWAAVVTCGKHKCGNPGRSGHRLAVAADREVFAIPVNDTYKTSAQFILIRRPVHRDQST
jgi:hypothetical protein